MSVKLTNITKQYPTQTSPIYKDFSAEFEQNKVHAILGVSGSGKTTLLNIVANAIDYSGIVERGEVSYVFQDARLINNITVANNLRLVLNGVIADKKEVDGKINEILRLAEIEQFADKYADELSGGERQRVSLARAFAYPSDILLMDEPFNSLDYGVKARIMQQFVKLNAQSARTVLFVTHDVDEALSIADEVYVLQGSPATLNHVATLSSDKSTRDIYSDDLTALKRQIVTFLQGVINTKTQP